MVQENMIYLDVLEFYAETMNALEEQCHSTEWMERFILMTCCNTYCDKPDRFNITKPLEVLEYIKAWDKKYNNGKYSMSEKN